MKKGDIKQLRVNNTILACVLGVLVLLIVGLGAGIIISNLNKNRGEEVANNTQTGTVAANEVESESYKAASESCEIIMGGREESNEKEFGRAIEQLEAASEDPEVGQNPDFKDCYVSLRNYYSANDDEEKVDYYNEIIAEKMMSDDDKLLEEQVKQFYEQAGGGE